ncbi:hypothetical protein V1477_013666, partial [Vespula maculifrons]
MKEDRPRGVPGRRDGKDVRLGRWLPSVRPSVTCKVLNRLRTADGTLPGGKYVFGSDWHEIEMAGGREPGKYVIRIIVDPLSLPDTCAMERYGADTG